MPLDTPVELNGFRKIDASLMPHLFNLLVQEATDCDYSLTVDIHRQQVSVLWHLKGVSVTVRRFAARDRNASIYPCRFRAESAVTQI
jgi:hypothetical protein